MTITVTRKGPKSKGDALAAKYMLTCDDLPGQQFGPYWYRDICNELYVLTQMELHEIRDVVLDAWVTGSATESEV